jgi:hypothetical protein
MPILTMIPKESFSSEEWDTQHVSGLYQQLVLGLLKVLCSQPTILLYRWKHL